MDNSPESPIATKHDVQRVHEKLDLLHRRLALKRGLMMRSSELRSRLWLAEVNATLDSITDRVGSFLTTERVRYRDRLRRRLRRLSFMARKITLKTGINAIARADAIVSWFFRLEVSDAGFSHRSDQG